MDDDSNERVDDYSRWRGYAEEIGGFLESEGMPRISARVLGWFLVCQPAHQSAEELAEAMQVSRGSISMAMQMLRQVGAVERHPMPGSRRTYYRMRPGFWLEEAGQKARQARQWAELADRGVKLLSDTPGTDTARLRETRDMYAFLAEQYDGIEQRWQRHRDQGGTS